MRRSLWLLCCLWCVGPASAQSPRLELFVSIAPQVQIVGRIGGEHVRVMELLPAGQTPETFAPGPKLLAALAQADIYFQIGVPFEKHWATAMQSVNPDMLIVTCCDQYAGRSDSSVTQTGHDHEHDNHIWSSPAYVARIAAEIRDALVMRDPGHRAEYEHNLTEFLAEIAVLDNDIRAMLAGRRTDYFIVSHAAWGDFAHDYQLIQISLEKNGKEPGPQALAGIIRLAERERLDTLFVVGQYKSGYLQNLAGELDATLVELDPLAADYLANMRSVAAAIAKSLVE